MHIIFIRHGDPDYSIDSVTEKGKKELELLAKRVKNWKVDEYFASPMGRAAVTAEACCRANPAPFTTMPWLREFNYDCKDPKTGKRRICWDLMPHEYFGEKKHFDIKKWHQTKINKSGNIKDHYREVCDGIDEILKGYDYSREYPDLPIYNCYPHLTKEEAKIDTHLLAEQKDLDEHNLVFVCHLGVMFALISHLTGISPVQLWHGFFVAPSSVTVLGAEERNPGEVIWRIQKFGDVSHLTLGGENASASGYFGNYFNG